MRYLSVCSGIEAASVAWHPLGWEAVAYSEIDAFPSAVLAHHYPTVPNWGDMTRFQEWPDAVVDVLVGGTPCQSFSVAGLRKGLVDPRGNLAITYLAILDRYRPTWCCWENVPGVLSADAGGALGAFLGGLGELGYGFAYRVLDAQYFGLAQRRARVFVVGHLGDWRRAAAVLFERESLSGHPAPRREAGQVAAATLTNGFGERGVGPQYGEFLSDGTCYTLNCTEQHAIAHSLRADGFDASKEYRQDGIANAVLTPNGGRGGIGVGAVAFHENQRAEVTVSDTAGSLKVGGGKPGQGYPAVAFGWNKSASQTMSVGETTNPLQGSETSNPAMVHGMQVRRLTPRECCRLQGFPDDYLDILYRGKPAADGNKYKALGNSMAVPVMAWIGRRLMASVSA